MSIPVTQTILRSLQLKYAGAQLLTLRFHNAAASRGPGADKAESPQLPPSAL